MKELYGGIDSINSTASSLTIGLETARELHTLSNRCQETVPSSMQIQSRGRMPLGDLLQPNGALRMPAKSHVFSLHGRSGKPLVHETSNHLRNSIIDVHSGYRCWSKCSEVQHYWTSNFNGWDGHLLGPVSIATNLAVPGMVLRRSAEESVRFPRSIIRPARHAR